MSLKASAHSLEGLRQEILVDEHFRLVTDEPVSVGGDGSAPAPHELLPAALASCIATTLVMYARTKKWDLGQVSVDVDYDHRSTPRRFEVVIRTGKAVTPEQLARLEKVAASCPVRRAIESGIVFEERIEPPAASPVAA